MNALLMRERVANALIVETKFFTDYCVDQGILNADRGFYSVIIRPYLYFKEKGFDETFENSIVANTITNLTTEGFVVTTNDKYFVLSYE